MGIPRFFRWIGERYPCLSQVVKQYQIPDFDNLYLDVNGIIHTCSHPDDDNPHFRITEEKIFADICRYLEFLFTMIKPQKVFFIAVDGVAPRAKMNQQRGRRFKSAKMAADQEAAAQRRGEKLPDTERFDSNCITPGTDFMAKLDNVLNHFIQYKISTDPNWQSVTVYYSSHSVPGEGEHKIMDFLRYQRSLPTYNPETRHCLYGLDTDLIMLGLVTHEPYFSLLREEILFKKSAKRPTCPEQTTFFLLHLRLFREYLEFEFRDLAVADLKFNYDLERIIDDWVLIEFLIGNDFIPHVPDCHVASNDLPELWKIYKELLPTLDGYLNEKGRLNLPRFERFIQALANFDRRKFESRYDDIKYMAGKTGKQLDSQTNGQGKSNNDEDSPDDSSSAQLISVNERKLMKQLMPFYSPEDELLGIGDESLGGEDGAHMMPDPSSTSPPREEEEDDDDDDSVDERTEEDMAFRSFKRDYYRSKMQLSGEKAGMRTADFVRLQAASYIEAIEWTLRYYYEGVPSWSWFYPFHYAPYLSDMVNISKMKLDFTLGSPFHPFEQLMSVLPSASRKLLPGSYRSLMTDATSSIRHFYPEDFATDLNGKQLDWEAVVLIPFIEEQQLLSAIRPLEKTLSPAESARNSFGTINAFRYAGDTNGTIIQSSLTFVPKYTNCANVDKLSWGKFHLTPNEVNRDYPREALRSLIYVPNFPTFKHLPCDASLYAAGTSVFKMPSRNLNMIVKVSDSVVPTLEAIDSVAASQIGSIVLVNWPFLTEARIISIYTPVKYYTTEETDYSAAEFKVVESAHNDDSARIYEADISYTRRYFYTTHGLDFRQSKCIVYAVALTGIKYAENEKQQLTAVKLWSTNPQPYPYEGVVFNLKGVATEDSILAAPPVSVMTTKLGELYPLGESVFVVNENYFGRMGIVIGYDERRNSVKVRLRMSKQPKFEDLIRRLQTGAAGIVYNPCQMVARHAGVSSFFLSRLSGCLRVKKESKPGDNAEVVKVNIGLDLKHTRDNLRIPGYTLRDEKGSWLYSEAVADLVRQYKAKFPQMLKRLQDLVDSNVNDPYSYADVFPDAKDSHQLDHVREFLTSLPTAKMTPVPNDSFILEEQLVLEIDKLVVKRTQPQFQEVFMKPDHLYRPKLTNRVNLSTDHFGNGNGQHFNLLDRVINIAASHSVPLGLEGTIIGILEEQNTTLNAYEEKPAAGAPRKVTYEVLFDTEFQHGATIRCPEKRGYRMFPQNLLGIRRTISSSKQISNCVTEAASRAHSETKPRPYANVVAAGAKPSNNQPNQPDATALWAALGGSNGEKAERKQDNGPWPLVPANLLLEQGAKQQRQQPNSGKKQPRNQATESNAIPIPPRVLMKQPNEAAATPLESSAGSLTKILKSIGVPEVVGAIRNDVPPNGTPSVPVIGGVAPSVAASLDQPKKQQKQQQGGSDWEPKDITPHDWDKIMSGAGIKVTALPSPARPDRPAPKQAESPRKANLPKSASGTVSQSAGAEINKNNNNNEGGKAKPLRERQTSTSVSGHQFVKLFNGAPVGAASSSSAPTKERTASSSEDDGNVSPVALKKVFAVDNKKTPSKQQPDVVEDDKIKNLQRDLANLKTGKPVEFASSSSSADGSPIVLSPSKPSATPQRLNATQLIASVASSTSLSAAKPKQQEQVAREDHVEKLSKWAERNDLQVRYETNIVPPENPAASAKCKFTASVMFFAKSRTVGVAPRSVDGPPASDESEAKRQAAKFALKRYGNASAASPRRQASPRKEVEVNGKKMSSQSSSFVPVQVMKNVSTGGRNNNYANNNYNGGIPPSIASVPMLGGAAPPPSALPIPVTVAGSFFSSPSATDVMATRSSNNVLASLLSPNAVRTITLPGQNGGSYESPSAFTLTAAAANAGQVKPFDLNILLNKQQPTVQQPQQPIQLQQQQQVQSAFLQVMQQPVAMPVVMPTVAPIQVQPNAQQAIPLSFILPSYPAATAGQPMNSIGATQASLMMASSNTQQTAVMTASGTAAAVSSPAAGDVVSAKPRAPRIAARFGAAPPVPSTAGQ